jgi:hypothetical protein
MITACQKDANNCMLKVLAALRQGERDETGDAVRVSDTYATPCRDDATEQPQQVRTLVLSRFSRTPGFHHTYTLNTLDAHRVFPCCICGYQSFKHIHPRLHQAYDFLLWHPPNDAPPRPTSLPIRRHHQQEQPQTLFQLFIHNLVAFFSHHVPFDFPTYPALPGLSHLPKASNASATDHLLAPHHVTNHSKYVAMSSEYSPCFAYRLPSLDIDTSVKWADAA